MLFNIKIDNTLMSYLAQKGIRVEELIVLICFNLNRLDLMRQYLTGKTGDQMIAYLQSLERKQLLRKITPELEEFDWDNYELTDLADEVFDDCSLNVSELDIQSLLPQLAAIPTHLSDTIVGGSDDDDMLAFVDEYLAMFPQGVRNGGGESLRAHPKDVLKKMRAFFNKYKFERELVKKATQGYLDRQRMTGYQWCSSAHFFISKNGISKLAGECENYKEVEHKEEGDWTNRLM
jgi:hypothetical protein